MEEKKIEKTKQYSLAKNEIAFLQARATIQNQNNFINKDLEFIMRTYVMGNVCQRIAMKREEYVDFEVNLDKGTVVFVLPEKEKGKDEKK